MSQRFEFSTGQRLNQVFWNTCNRHDIRQVDFCRSRRRQFYLSLFCCFFQTLQCHRVSFQISTFVLFKLFCQPVNDNLVKVITTKVSITVCRKNFEHATTELKNRDIECTTTKVEHCNLHIFVCLIHTIS